MTASKNKDIMLVKAQQREKTAVRAALAAACDDIRRLMDMIKGIAFDKDGTLLDYEAFWLPVAEEACRHLLAGKNAEVSAVMEAIGAYDGISGLLCHGTYGDIAARMNQTVLGASYTAEDIAAAVSENLYLGKFLPTCPHMRDVLLSLKSKGLVLAVVTSDNGKTTEYCLDQLGIKDVFDHIYSDDGDLPPKPAPDYMLDLCRRFSLVPDEVLMVGDTLSDMKFAKNSGTHGIGVAKQERDRAVLAPVAERVLHDISALLTLDL